jgi:hypothetical protein
MSSNRHPPNCTINLPPCRIASRAVFTVFLPQELAAEANAASVA